MTPSGFMPNAAATSLESSGGSFAAVGIEMVAVQVGDAEGQV
jgi:hypothetical protein